MGHGSDFYWLVQYYLKSKLKKLYDIVSISYFIKTNSGVLDSPTSNSKLIHFFSYSSRST